MQLDLPFKTKPRILWDLDIGSNHIRVCLDDEGQVVMFSWPREWKR